MGDQPHIIELIDQLLSETANNPKLQEKIFDLRDALFQTQQVSQQYALEIKSLEENIAKLKSSAHRIGTVLGIGEEGLYRLVDGDTEYQAAVSPEILEKEILQSGGQMLCCAGKMMVCFFLLILELGIYE